MQIVVRTPPDRQLRRPFPHSIIAPATRRSLAPTQREDNEAVFPADGAELSGFGLGYEDGSVGETSRADGSAGQLWEARSRAEQVPHKTVL